ncbi:shufflon system plasmid conjugative transfer pilus tip adhesin PilV [Escherichia coli]|uniref:Shufflon system plasmid conjugative transfer pilus tip adhesin PilV n=5 Tax=Escherichia coli TaxID=562 RepID=A0A785IMW9_ECOLX|nr:shufflon system plasmid conjugative transfer pilus tip adhesin PilV [Escherichia coli]EAY6268821.1 shufflon system plasmid conjugative transfer pilus tip adhesin PilV [Salmonella enterica]EDC8957809.1 shufflon system plasmid conjugative transfer pilus tip adhesin PilV [Salmonella enterica subsp. enterica serovar Schwarzengrund]AXZ81683.1 shufflon system plasmid conjugative transfer pilus tip adhesin PilV [Escherichia coli]EBP4332308.1 shufflon system plasmid conjugative transfer pilus tip ad
MKKFRHDDDKGFILLEILAGLIVIGIATPMIYSEIEDWLNEQLYQSAALHADEYNNAIKNYVADKTSSLSSKTITVNELIQQGYLNNGFSRSPFGHSYITGIRKNNLSGRLEALTCTTGGQDIKEDGLRRIAGQINGLGGFMLQNNSVTGAFGGWTDLGSNYQITCNKGHIAMRMAGKDLEESDRLYRYSVQGRPDLNRMHTGIDMNNNSITNINEASGKNARFSGDVTSNRWLHPNGGGFTMTDSQWIRAVNNKGITTEGELKGGKVSGGTVRSEGRLSTGEYLQLDKTATAGTSCSPDGLVGRDSTGAILSCQSGSWIRVSGSTVLTGKIANGERLPLPSGFSASQCTWSVSNAENPHGWKPNYFAGSVATYDSNRIVKCGYYDEYNFHGGTKRNDLTGKCSYIVVCQ